MIGKTISHYKIVEKLGEGGMGVVYRAEDKKLKRTVALKFFRPLSFSDEEQRRLFIQEARAAAALDHPNICTIYEIDEVDDQFFISMAYVEGVDLKEKLKAGPLEVDRVLYIGLQIAQALESAHKKGIIHHDIKSANIMVSADDHARIMDFGLAKMAGGTELHDEFISGGTSAYISPEQARGEETDHRTDIWAWGVCFYEMLTGQLPFRGTYEASVVYSILNEDPAPISDLRGGIPLKLERIIEKALAKELDERYQSVTDVIKELKKSEEELKLEVLDDQYAEEGLVPSVAVLPFADMSPEKDQEYFCDGITEEIINSLTRVVGLRVVSRTSAFAYKEKPEDIRKIGRKLGVGTILEGSVRKAGTKLRITTQLINVADGYHIWTEQYNRELEDVFAIQEEIAENIVRALEIELNEKEKDVLEKPAAKDVEAYDFYLRGRKYFYQSKRESIHAACDMFEKAIEKDPSYARAYAGIADCYTYLFLYFDRKDENLEEAMKASQKALELDPELAEAHAARGLAVALDHQYEESEREFERAIRLNPKLFEAYYFYARASFVRSEFEKTARLYEQAARVDPENYLAPMMLGFAYRGLNQTPKAEKAYRRGMELVEKHVEMNPDDSRALYLGSSALIELGEREKSMEWAKRALEADPNNPYNIYGIACFHSQLGEVDDALHFFERAVELGFAHKEWIENDTDLDPLRDHPRFKAILDTLE
ncbi:MAG: protein kinase [Candidatus Latescibacteria bacterium]|nr:protein kinase [Candidatus Latescibacterota bacterium]NIO28474.1 protein kinase [Candidatus Latescibacterota bacterium]NIO56023.1 protein kinase [Candidatus Latescibacterota bacterium]NIT01987.1 protein kinase [Candidatus Latescibacterota bacterium]